MTLFSPDDLNQVFPEATADALADPNLDVYTGYAEAYVEAQESAGRVALTGGSEDAIGQLIVEEEKHEASPDFMLLVNKAKNKTAQIIEGAFSYDPNYEKYQEEASKLIDWYALEKIYDRYVELELNPEIVITPDGYLPVDWKNIYKYIRDVQSSSDKEIKFPLNDHKDGEFILLFPNAIKGSWKDYVGNYGWSVSIIPTTDTYFKDPDEPYENYYSKSNSNIRIVRFMNSLSHITDTMSPLIKNKRFQNPTVESYLMLQAYRILEDVEPLDLGSLNSNPGFVGYLGYDGTELGVGELNEDNAIGGGYTHTWPDDPYGLDQQSLSVVATSTGWRAINTALRSEFVSFSPTTNYFLTNDHKNLGLILNVLDEEIFNIRSRLDALE